MGWLELLPLLKRLLPLLNRVAPMLETFVAARAGTRGEADAALERAAADIKNHLAATAQQHGSVADLLTAQGERIASLTEGINRLRSTDDRTAARLLEIEVAVGAVARTLRTVAILLAVLMTACIGLLIALLLHRP